MRFLLSVTLGWSVCCRPVPHKNYDKISEPAQNLVFSVESASFAQRIYLDFIKRQQSSAFLFDLSATSWVWAINEGPYSALFSEVIESIICV